MQGVPRRTVGVLAITTTLVCGAAGFPVVAGAGVPSYDVTNLADAGPGSLRQALLDVSDDGIDDVVVIDPALADGTITLTSGELVYSGDGEALTIQGAGVTVDAAGASRVFRNDATGLLTIEDLTITGGHLDETDAEEIDFDQVVRGAGLLSFGDVALRRTIVSDNIIEGVVTRVDRAEGAGVGVNGSVVLDASSITQNRILGLVAEAAGAGIWSHSITGAGATVTGNRLAPDDAFVGFGAGMYGGTISLVDSAVSDNYVHAGVFAAGGGAFATDAGAFEQSSIERNVVESEGFAGGGGVAAEATEIRSSAVGSNVARSLEPDEAGRVGGGAVLFVGLEIADATFSDNRAEGSLVMGGALGTDFFTANEDGLPRTIEDSTFRGNVAESTLTDDYAFGGVLAADGFTIRRTLFVDNEARSDLGAFGGALTTASHDIQVAKPTVVEDSTFVGNAAVSSTTSAGGAITATAGDMSVARSTFAANIAEDGSAVGGLTIDHSPVSIDVASSALTGSSPLCGSDVTVGAHVVATDGSCVGASVVGDVGLGALADNGGPTDTMLPQPGSPLVDAIAAGDPACGDVDQRGVARPVGPACDIGAVETTDPLQVVGAWDAQLLAGDFDGDGVDDVFGYRPGSASDGIAWNGAPKAFRSQRVNGDYLPLVEDFDGDGDDDVFWYAAGSRPDYLWWSDGDRTFTSTPARVNGTYQPFVGDFDGNGAGDVFWYAPGSTPDYVWWGGASGFSSRPTTVNGSYQPFVGDFDGDGATDITWYAPGSAADFVWWSDGDRTFRSVATRINGTYRTSTGDHDGDGKDDVFFHGRGARPDYVWWGAADRRFTSVPRTVGGTYGLVPGDFDGDGADDLLLHGSGGVLDVVHMGGTRGDFLT